MSKGENATSRSVSASEIARNIKYFETWCSYNGLEQVAFSDLSSHYRTDAALVFDLKGKIPEMLIDGASSSSLSLQEVAPGLLKFLEEAKSEKPALFSDLDFPSIDTDEDLIEDLGCVYRAWKKLVRMKESKDHWSEADFAANVYNVLRSIAFKRCAYRTQCNIHLPRHLENIKSAPESKRVLSTKIVIPDGSLFLYSESISKLSKDRKSPYNIIKNHSATKQSCGRDGENTFRYQATPASRPQATPGFEFAGAFIEDKKPGSEVESLDHAYRQNRMACSASLRHLHALRISSPVFGVIWADGKVRAHMDWFSSKNKNPSVFSAMYNGAGLVKLDATEDSPSAVSTITQSSATGSSDSDTSPSSEWDLSKPSDILCVFFLLRNLDDWMATTFKGRVERGVRSFSRAVKTGEVYQPWRHRDTALTTAIATTKRVQKEKKPLPLKENSSGNTRTGLRPRKWRVSSTTVTTTTTRRSSSLSLSLYR